MQLSYTLHFKGSKRYRLIKQQTLINIQQKTWQNIQEWTLNLNCSDKKVKTNIDRDVLK